MPIYNFKCSECSNLEQAILKVSEFIKLRKNPLKCSNCNKGIMYPSLFPPMGKIEKRKEDIVQEIEEEVREIVKKVQEGDEATIEDIYGHRKNPYKKTNGE